MCNRLSEGELFGQNIVKVFNTYHQISFPKGFPNLSASDCVWKCPFPYFPLCVGTLFYCPLSTSWQDPSSSNKIMICWRLTCYLAFSRNKVFLIKVYTLFCRHDAIAHFMDYSRVYTWLLYALGKKRSFCNPLYCTLHFICGGLAPNPQYVWGMPVLVSSGCHNETPQTRWLEQPEFVFSQF